jgi:hypothetical protein
MSTSAPKSITAPKSYTIFETGEDPARIPAASFLTTKSVASTTTSEASKESRFRAIWQRILPLQGLEDMTIDYGFGPQSE